MIFYTMKRKWIKSLIGIISTPQLKQANAN